jgi:hypothetical protein
MGGEAVGDREGAGLPGGQVQLDRREGPVGGAALDLGGEDEPAGVDVRRQRGGVVGGQHISGASVSQSVMPSPVSPPTTHVIVIRGAAALQYHDVAVAPTVAEVTAAAAILEGAAAPHSPPPLSSEAVVMNDLGRRGQLVEREQDARVGLGDHGRLGGQREDEGGRAGGALVAGGGEEDGAVGGEGDQQLLLAHAADALRVVGEDHAAAGAGGRGVGVREGEGEGERGDSKPGAHAGMMPAFRGGRSAGGRASAVDGDRGALGEEGGARGRGEGVDEGGAVEGGDVAAQGGVVGGPYAPGRVFDAVLEGAAGAVGVAPVMLGDELRLGAGTSGAGSPSMWRASSCQSAPRRQA